MTAQILRDNRWLNTPDHCDVLIARIKHRNMKVADAIDSLDGLSRSELCDIRQAELPKMPGWK